MQQISSSSLTSEKLVKRLKRLKHTRIKLRYFRYPLLLIQFMVPKNSRYGTYIRFARTILRMIKYYIYVNIGIVFLALKIGTKYESMDSF